MTLKMYSDGFTVKTAKQAEVCRKQGCRVAGVSVISVYPPVGRRINLPFKVCLGSWTDQAGIGTNSFTLLSGGKMEKGNVRVPAVWEIHRQR